MKKNLYSEEACQECLSRIDRVSADSRALWGSMSSAQMMAHCAEVLEVTNGKELRNTPFIVKLLGCVIRKMVVADKPFRRGAQTHPQYKQTEECDFASEKQRLRRALQAFSQQDKEKAAQQVHPLFGRMTLEEKGWGMYKHLDHHLAQFGV